MLNLRDEGIADYQSNPYVFFSREAWDPEEQLCHFY
jgi:hypothetical protein